jgi:hypothetical protein
MRLLSPRIHGYLDYLVVALFLLAPTIFGFSRVPTTVSYVVAGVHLVMSLLTDYPLGLARVVPFPLHGSLELIVAPVLVALPWVLNYAWDLPARNYYVGMGIVVFAVWLTTDYRATAHVGEAAEVPIRRL